MKDKRLFTEIKHRSGYKAHLAASGLITCILTLLIAMASSAVLSGVFIDGYGLKSVFPTLFALLAGILLKTAASFYFSQYFRREASVLKRSILSRHVHRLLDKGPLLTVSKNSGGSATLAGEAAEQLEPYYVDYLPALVSLMVSLPLLLLAAAYFDLISFLIMLATGPFLPFFLYLIGKESEKASRARLGSLTRLGGGLNDVLTGLRSLKLFGQTGNARQTVAAMSDGFRQMTMQVLRISFLSAFVLELAATISTAIIAVTLGTRLIAGHIDFFSCFFILLITPDYFMSIRRFGAKFHVSHNAKSAAEILLTPDTEDKERAPEGAHPFPSTIPTVRFNQVTYQYAPTGPEATDAPALHSLSLTLAPGSITALVGKSGAGKTTVANALLKLLHPQAGTITIDDMPIQDIDTEALRRSVSYIPQRPFIFKDTLKNNILLPQPDATTAALDAAVRDALLSELVAQLPEGLDTPITDLGQNLSAGERQRVAIARALLKDAPLVIVDEAVSAQDRENERLLTRAFERLSFNKTVLIIAHRLETVQSADYIYMLDQGTVCEEGTHDTLMAKNGAYSALVRSWEE